MLNQYTCVICLFFSIFLYVYSKRERGVEEGERKGQEGRETETETKREREREVFSSPHYAVQVRRKKRGRVQGDCRLNEEKRNKYCFANKSNEYPC